MGDTHVGLQARLMSQALRKLTANLNKSNTICLFINQLREKIGVMFGSPETTPGGRALKFYSSVRLDIRRIESIKDGVEVVGNRTRVKVVKNKVAPPFRQAEFDIMYGKGISREGSLLDIGVDLGIVKKSGAWYTYEGEQLGQGRENAKKFLAENPEIMVEISERVPQQVGIGQPGAEAAGASRRRRRSPRPTTSPISLRLTAGRSTALARSACSPRACHVDCASSGVPGQPRRSRRHRDVQWKPQGLDPIDIRTRWPRDGGRSSGASASRSHGRRRRRAEPAIKALAIAAVTSRGGHRPGVHPDVRRHRHRRRAPHRDPLHVEDRDPRPRSRPTTSSTCATSATRRSTRLHGRRRRTASAALRADRRLT